MRSLLLLASLIGSLVGSGRQSFQLAPPALKYASAFFTGSTSFEIVFNQPGTEVRYTLNGKEPGPNDLLYTGPVSISERTIVKAKAMGKDFLPSETVSAEFVKEGKAIRQAGFSLPNEYYVNAKPDILHDNAGGQPNFRAGGWLGYDKDTVEIIIELEKKEKIHSVLLDLLQDEHSWIFLPEQILLYYYDEEQGAYLPAGKELLSPEGPSPKGCSLREMVPTTAISTNKLRIELHVLKNMPDWHSAKGQHAWLFIDEVKVY